MDVLAVGESPAVGVIGVLPFAPANPQGKKRYLLSENTN